MSDRKELAVVLGMSMMLAFVYHRKQQRAWVRARLRAKLAEIMANRIPLPRNKLASETDDERINLPASLGSEGRLQLGDLGTVADLLDDGADSPRFRRHLERHPIEAVLVCMGSDAAAAVAKDFEKRKLTYLGLKGCVDEEGYPLLELHFKTSCAFIQAQLAAAAPNGCVLVHCKEGKNRSATICVAYLVAQERMPLTQAVLHVWSQRPIVLDNQSFVEQLIDLALAEGLAS